MSTEWQDEIQRRLEKERLARKILGVDRGADSTAVKKAFWLLAMKYHPDKCPHDKEARKRFANIVKAYEFLTTGEAKGWNPDAPENGDAAEEEERIGEYLANEWGYFCWWRDSFDFGAEEAEEQKSDRDSDEPESGDQR